MPRNPCEGRKGEPFVNKGLVIAIVVLISALASIAVLYQFYVKAIIEDLQQKTADREQIEQKLEDLETTFYNTKPEVIIKTWRQETQPWADAVFQRTDFFELRDPPEPIKVPEEKIPKFYYADEFPKLEDRLRDYVDEVRCRIPSGLRFDAPAADSLAGSNPSAQEVEKWMNEYEYGAYLIRFIADSGASEIIDLELWPPETILTGSTGAIERRRIGFTVNLTYEDLVSFLETMRTSDHYFSVDALMLTNDRLRNPDTELTAKMVVAQTHFIEYASIDSQRSKNVQGTNSPKAQEAQERFRNFFGDLSALDYANEEETWWSRFRRKWLPF